MRLIIACVSVGNYQNRGAEYVNRLFRGTHSHLPVPHEFQCFTDDGRGFDPGIIARVVPNNLSGWWAKLYLFAPRVFLESDRVLFFDLDTVITGPLDEIARWDGKFAILRDFYRPDGYGSGVMLWQGGFGAHIWNGWNEQGRPQTKFGDQAVIEALAPGAARLQDEFPGAFVSYKVNCRAGVPQDARVVCFHGRPKPHEIAEYWP